MTKPHLPIEQSASIEETYFWHEAIHRKAEMLKKRIPEELHYLVDGILDHADTGRIHSEKKAEFLRQLYEANYCLDKRPNQQ